MNNKKNEQKKEKYGSLKFNFIGWSLFALLILYVFLLGFIGPKIFDKTAHIMFISFTGIVLIIPLVLLKFSSPEHDDYYFTASMLLAPLGLLTSFEFMQLMNIPLAVICTLLVFVSLDSLIAVGITTIGYLELNKVRDHLLLSIFFLFVLVIVGSLITTRMTEFGLKHNHPEQAIITGLSCNLQEETTEVVVPSKYFDQKRFIRHNLKLTTEDSSKEFTDLKVRELTERIGGKKEIKSLSFIVPVKPSTMKVHTDYLLAPNISNRIQCS